MMVVGIIGVVALIGAPVLTNSIRYFVLTRVKLELQRESRSAMYVITRDLRQAQSNTIVIDNAAGQPAYSRITFTKSQGTVVTFYQTGSKLIQLVGNNQKTLSTNVCYMGFSFPRSDDMAMLSVSMTLQENTYSGQTKALHMASQKVQVMN